MKISVCITTFNEEDSIADLLNSLLKQTRKPDEIVVVDGGSKDRTVEIIKSYKNKKIKLFIKKGSIAVGRNESVRCSRGDIVALIDAGCIAKSSWLENLTKDFIKEEVGLVAGFYEMPAKSSFQKAVSVFLGVPPQRFNPKTFLPSARSVAFRKSLWKKLGGFDEKLTMAGEDTKFFYEAVRCQTKIVRAKNAKVVWMEVRHLTYKGALRKFYIYAKGDAQAGIWWHPKKRLSSHNLKISSIFMRYLFGIILLIFSPTFAVFTLLLYSFYVVWKWKDVLKSWRTRFWLPIIQISSDFAVMAGFIVGTI